MKVSASIVTYNNEKEIRGVLNSLKESDCISDICVYVVDNCSADSTTEIVAKEYPFVKLIHSPKNGGYGYGHNQAMKVTDADIHFVINPDILFEPSLLSDMVDYLEENPKAVAAIPAICDEEWQIKYPPKRDPRLRYLLGRFFPQIKAFEKWRDLYQGKDLMKSQENAFELEVCSGSFMALRMSAVRQVGYFDERYFMYFEDFDLSRSLRAEGKIMCLPKLRVIHEGKRAAHRSSRALKMILSSMFKYFLKWGWRF